ncbi:putative nucleotidyltransferase with HDIG domain [Pseudodesulfovibrio indicus]|uniref:Nucleotidyltransferase with HDIG domain n=1 Tax=Pseudodesulfovibrio indicus TaxID=1716143 RepID=A0AA94PJL1_9BACT|nr:HD-GYP domain-containing protein [Pseudodesulfovibrio indicus]TDT86820.1 putative nucleotidyltransferase with HDIG domain [Pseudodesulfovibrio indicus]
MVERDMPEYRIPVDQLRPGVFIRLEKTSWFEHPFLFSNFKVRDFDQIALIKSLGITHVMCIPEKSDVLPAAPEKRTEAKRPEPRKQLSQEVIDHLWEVKRERTRRLREKKDQIALCEKRFNACIKTFNDIYRDVAAGRTEGVGHAVGFVARLAALFLDDRESTLHLMNVVDKGESAYSHPMNVAVLSMIVGKEARLDEAEMTVLALGALFHDIGKERLPKKLLKKRGELTRPEQNLLDEHPALGAEIIAGLKGFPDGVARILAQHHERMDGSGVPGGLKGETIDRLARIVAVADAYDNHCNHADPMESLTPYLALSYMFGQQKHLFDVELLALFIRCLGVYPPGTVVELSNGDVGMVMAVNPKNQLNPSVMLHDPEVPKKEALIVDLADEPDLRVEKSIRLAQLPPETLEYLSPRTRITYYVDRS